MIASVAAYFFAVFTEQQRFGAALLPASVLCLVSIFEFVLGDIIAERTFPEGTLSKMEVLRHVRTKGTLREITRILATLVEHPVLAGVPLLATAHLRIELFGPLDDEAAPGSRPTSSGLLQLVDYQSTRAVPEHERREGRFRVTPQYQGLIGRCLRTEEEDFVAFDSEEDYFNKMVHDFGFSKAEAERHSKTARSYYACPIRHPGEPIVGVLYMYSTEKALFPRILDSDGSLRVAVDTACRQIASLLVAQDLGSR